MSIAGSLNLPVCVHQSCSLSGSSAFSVFPPRVTPVLCFTSLAFRRRAVWSQSLALRFAVVEGFAVIGKSVYLCRALAPFRWSGRSCASSTHTLPNCLTNFLCNTTSVLYCLSSRLCSLYRILSYLTLSYPAPPPPPVLPYPPVLTLTSPPPPLRPPPPLPFPNPPSPHPAFSTEDRCHTITYSTKMHTS